MGGAAAPPYHIAGRAKLPLCPNLNLAAMPREVRGEFKPITTSVPDIQICEHLPKLARMMDQCALIRSIDGWRRAVRPGVSTVQKDPVELLRRSARPGRPSLSRHPLGEQRGTLVHPGAGEVIVGLEEVIDRKGHFLNVLKDGRVEVGPERGFQ